MPNDSRNHSEEECLDAGNFLFLEFFPVSSRRIVLGFWACLIFCAASNASAQGSFGGTFLATGNGETLISSETLLAVGPGPSELAFDFGFLSDEAVVPGVFLDSFTVTLSGNGGFSAILATIDSSGVSWTPVPPDGNPIQSAQIRRMATAPSGLPPVSGRGLAYSARLTLPDILAGSQARITFDLFDNLDPQMSAGWYNNVQIVPVPEPRFFSLLGLGLLSMAILKRRIA
jgi:hypothetical protein